jgi:hypothetical protein
MLLITAPSATAALRVQASGHSGNLHGKVIADAKAELAQAKQRAHTYVRAAA